MKKGIRFQESSKLVQIWRYRWYIPIPFQWIRMMILFYLLKDKTEEDYYFTGRNLWEILIGSAQVKMDWYYTNEEITKKFNKK